MQATSAAVPMKQQEGRKSRSASKSSLFGKNDSDADSDCGISRSSPAPANPRGGFEKRKTVAELFKRQNDDFNGSVSPRANSEGDLLEFSGGVAVQGKTPSRRSIFHRSSKNMDPRPSTPQQNKSGFFNPFDLIMSKRNSTNGTNSPRTTEEESESGETLSFKNYSLEEVLSSKELLPYFRHFLESEHSEENLDFWQSIQDFKDEASMDRANEIFDTYLKSGAEKEVNINFEIKNTVERNLPFPTYRVFEKAEDSIFQLMKTDSYQRFKSKPPQNINRSRFPRFLNHSEG